MAAECARRGGWSQGEVRAFCVPCCAWRSRRMGFFALGWGGLRGLFGLGLGGGSESGIEASDRAVGGAFSGRMGFLRFGGAPRRVGRPYPVPAPVFCVLTCQWCRWWLLFATFRKGWRWPHGHGLAGWAAASMTALRLNAARRLAVGECFRR